MMTKGEISFDLIMEEEMDWLEGTYRLNGGEWNILIFFSDDRVQQIQLQFTAWQTGARGIEVRYPSSVRWNKARVIQLLSETLHVSEWTEVRGPDSMNLR